MKNILKYISIFVFLLTSTLISAQEASEYDAKVDYSASWIKYNPATSTTYATSATDSIWYYTILRESIRPVKYDIVLDIDSISGTVATVPVILQSKLRLEDSWTNLATKTWTTGASDTTIRFTNIATPTFLFASDSTITQTANIGSDNRYYRVYIKTTNSGFIIRISELFAKFSE